MSAHNHLVSHTRKRNAFLALALSVAGAGALSYPAKAATVDWKLAGADTVFSNAGNWTALPANSVLTDIARFNQTAPFNFQPNLTANYSVNGLIFDGSDPTTLTLDRTAGTLSIGGSGITLAHLRQHDFVTSVAGRTYELRNALWHDTSPSAAYDACSCLLQEP